MRMQPARALKWLSGLGLVGLLLIAISVGRKFVISASASNAGPSTIQVETNSKGPLILTTKTAEFRVLPSGYVQAFLVKDGHKLTLDDPATGDAAGDFVVQGGKQVHFSVDLAHAKVVEASGKLGAGKRIEIPGEALGSSGANLQRVLTIEVYDDFPTFLFSSTEYHNSGPADVHIEQMVGQRHRFNAHLVDAKAQPYEMWSFQGSSYDWGKDDVRKLTAPFFQPNVLGAVFKGR